MTGRIVSPEEAKALREGANDGPWDRTTSTSREWALVHEAGDELPDAHYIGRFRDDDDAALAAAAPDLAYTVDQQAAQIAQLRRLLDGFVHPDDPCWFDHHGGCQAHGFLNLKPGEVCPAAEAIALLGVTS